MIFLNHFEAGQSEDALIRIWAEINVFEIFSTIFIKLMYEKLESRLVVGPKFHWFFISANATGVLHWKYNYYI